MEIKLIKEKKEDKNYQAEDFKIYYRHKGMIAGDNSLNAEELIYLISGSTEVALEDDTWVVEAPAKIEFPAKTYHKLKALTDIAFVLFEK